MYDAAQLQDAVAYQAPPSLRQSEESGDNICFCIHPPEQSRLFQTESALCPFLRGYPLGVWFQQTTSFFLHLIPKIEANCLFGGINCQEVESKDAG